MTRPVVARVAVDSPAGSDTVAVADPTIGWVTETTTPGWVQASAEVELTLDGAPQRVRLDSEVSVRVPWPFPPLSPRDEGALRVRVTGADGIEGPWSEPTPVFAIGRASCRERVSNCV